MLSLLGQIRFASPLVAIILPALLGFLVYAYFRKGRGAKSIVPTLFLFQKLQNPGTARSSFLPPLHFFSELFLILLLMLLLAGISIKREEKSIAIVLDNSFSMNARARSTSVGRNALELAKRQLEPVLASLGSWDRVQVVLASDRQQPDELLSVSQAAEKIRLAQVEYAADRLETQIESLLSKGEYSKVYVASDRNLRPVSNQSQNTFESRLVSLSVEQELIAGNYAFTAVRSESSSKDPDRFDAIVTVANFSGVDAQILVEVQSVQAEAENKFVRLRASKETLNAGQSREVRFSNLEATPFYRFELRPEIESQILSDAIEQDNTAWLVHNRTGRDVAFFGELSLQDLGLMDMKGYRISREPGAQPLFSIYHRTLPENYQLNGNTLIVMPPIGSQQMERQNLVRSPLITRWLDSHPLTAYLNLPALTLKVAAPLNEIPWASNVISSDQGALLFAGRKEASKVVVSGVELFPFAGKNSPVLSILTLNIFKWLSDADQFQEYLSPGDVLEWQAADSSGNFEPRSLIQAELRQISPGRSLIGSPGLLKTGDPSQGTLVRAINFFDAQESSVNHKASTVDTGIDVRSQIGSVEPERVLPGTLLLILVVLLIINLALLLRDMKLPARGHK